LEPFDVKGVGFVSSRYLDAAKQDDAWLYLPALRRVRRLSTAQRSDALFGQDTDVDSYGGYAGHIAWMDWRYLGERDLLAVAHGRHFPVQWNDKVDVQLEHATKASLPSHRFPGEQGWYFNQGEKAGITDDWFTVAALVNAGH